MFESVFTTQDLIAFFDNYFERIAWESQCLVIRSKNTGHYWEIIHTGRNDVPYILFHKHKRWHNYHKQCNCLSVQSAIRKIKKHDDYVLNKKPLNR